MLEIFVGAKFKFMRARRYAYVFSGILMLISILSLVIHGGPRESIDFTGGNLLYVKFSDVVKVGDVRSAAEKAKMEGAVIQMAQGNTEAIIHYRAAAGDTSKYFDTLKADFEAGRQDTMALMSKETVGPKIGSELEQKATMAIVWSLILILGYIAWRFTRISFGLGAVIALFHDILITLGVFSILNREVSLTVVAAFLTIGGYSINDTIVVFDRIRENLKLGRRMTFQDIIDRSVNQTLSRTILTGGTTLLTVCSLFVLGGVVIHDFALAMLVGVVIGTYSSIFVASALALDISNWWNRRKTEREKRPASRRAAAS